MTALEIVKEYYASFNARNWEAMRALLTEDIKHETNQGSTRVGLELFEEFQAHMEKCYEETLTDMVFMADETVGRVAVEFVVNGKYISTDDGLPEAKGQIYVLPAGAFLSVKEGKIERITTYYNLPLWTSLVSA